MNFIFEATTPVLDHEIGQRLNQQARKHLAPDFSIMSVTAITSWRFDGELWRCDAEAMVHDGRDFLDSFMASSDEGRSE